MPVYFEDSTKSFVERSKQEEMVYLKVVCFMNDVLNRIPVQMT